MCGLTAALFPFLVELRAEFVCTRFAVGFEAVGYLEAIKLQLPICTDTYFLSAAHVSDNKDSSSHKCSYYCIVVNIVLLHINGLSLASITINFILFLMHVIMVNSWQQALEPRFLATVH